VGAFRRNKGFRGPPVRHLVASYWRRRIVRSFPHRFRHCSGAYERPNSAKQARLVRHSSKSEGGSQRTPRHDSTISEYDVQNAKKPRDSTQVCLLWCTCSRTLETVSLFDGGRGVAHGEDPTREKRRIRGRASRWIYIIYWGSVGALEYALLGPKIGI